MEIFGGGMTCKRDSLEPGDWVISANRDGQSCLARILSDNTEGNISLRFELSDTEKIDIIDTFYLGQWVIKLSVDPILQIYPSSSQASHDGCKSGYLYLDSEGSPKVAIMETSLIRPGVQWAQLQGNKLEPKSYSSDLGIFFKKWELILPGFAASQNSASFKFGF